MIDLIFFGFKILNHIRKTQNKASTNPFAKTYCQPKRQSVGCFKSRQFIEYAL